MKWKRFFYVDVIEMLEKCPPLYGHGMPCPYGLIVEPPPQLRCSSPFRKEGQFFFYPFCSRFGRTRQCRVPTTVIVEPPLQLRCSSPFRKEGQFFVPFLFAVWADTACRVPTGKCGAKWRHPVYCIILMVLSVSISSLMESL